VSTRGLSLTTRIFAAIALVVTTVLLGTLAVTGYYADRAAEQAVTKAVASARETIRGLLVSRERTLIDRATVVAGASTFRSPVESRKMADVQDQAFVASQQIDARWVQIIDSSGTRLAKSDEPAADSVNLRGSRLVMLALDSAVSAGAFGVSNDTLIQVVTVPIVGASASVVGALMAVRLLDASFADSLKRATGGSVDVVLFALDSLNKPQLRGSTVGLTPDVRKLVASLPTAKDMDMGRADSLSREEPMRVSPDPVLDGVHYVAIGEPLRTGGGKEVGGFLVLRNKDQEFAAFNQLRTIILGGGAAGIVIAGLLALLVARQITRPVGALVEATRRAAQGDYATDITVNAGGEIGTLADAFRSMLTDLREKAALVEFLGGTTANARTVRMSQVGISSTLANQVEAGGIAPGTRFAGRYDVKEILGVGGMGLVFKALDSELGEVIAIKVLKGDFASEDPSALERFKSEIRLARRISHRNVVRTHDFGEFAGTYYITMEYVEGKSLKDAIKNRGRLPVQATLTVGKQLCRALEVAHEQGVIHRDIKPQNMVVEPDGVLKVMDFGIARMAKRTSGVTQVGMVVGTPEYMAPEQLMGDEIDSRADLYSAGCVLYECLTGRVPITADSQITLIARVLEDTPTPPRELNPEVPAALSDLILRTLAKNAADRPATATELHDLLAAIG
jgi:HAMP domain-containing protein/predicted Ser/Thr protein kinase